MKYEHTHIILTEPAPGHFAISNIPACRTMTDAGLIVAPSDCYISPEVPTDLLKAIIAEREKGTAKTGKTAKHSKDADKPSLLDSIIGALQDGPSRIGDLAESLGCEKEEIKALSGSGFEVAAAGWVKLLAKEASE